MCRISTHYHGFTVEHQFIMRVLFQFQKSTTHSIWIDVNVVWVFKLTKCPMGFYDILIFANLFNHLLKMIFSLVVIKSLADDHRTN